MFGHGVTQRRAPRNILTQLLDDVRQPPLRTLAGKHVQRAQHRHAGAQQIGKLTVERSQVARFDSVPTAEDLVKLGMRARSVSESLDQLLGAPGDARRGPKGGHL